MPLYPLKVLRTREHASTPLSQPYFDGSVKMKLTLPKLGFGNFPRLLKLQSSIVGVKTPRIGVYNWKANKV
jgi:hypothetical protein